MNFFCTKEHYEEWVERSGQDTSDLFILPMKEAIVVAEWVFGLSG